MNQPNIPSVTSTTASMNHSSRLSYFLRHPAKGLYKEFVTLTGGLLNLSNDPRALKLQPEILDVFDCNDESAISGDLNMYEIGGRLQRERLAGIADFCASRFSGDLVEIGACRGETTRLLGQVARKHGRRLVVIDPWVLGSQDCSSDEYETFLKNTEDIRDVLDVWRESSTDKGVVKRLSARQLCFSFVDGWHVLHACLSDIISSGHAKGVIAIDDTRYNHDLLFSVRRGAKKLNRPNILQHNWHRESYIFSNGCIKY